MDFVQPIKRHFFFDYGVFSLKKCLRQKFVPFEDPGISAKAQSLESDNAVGEVKAPL